VPGQDAEPDSSPKQDAGLAHDGERQASGGSIPEGSQDNFRAALIDADGRGHEAEYEIDDLRQRFNHISGLSARGEAEHSERNVDFYDA
jgi:hypothetical protein